MMSNVVDINGAEATAGSMPIFLNIKGRDAPMMAALVIFAISEKDTINVNSIGKLNA